MMLSRRENWIPLLAIITFVATIFLSALLLFSIQPMFAKMLLPLLGGAPQVWNTCMLFFQGVLLAGYAYAHFSLRWFGRSQILIHLAIVGSVLVLLPDSVAPELPVRLDGFPGLWLLWVLTLSIGPAFFALSSTTPLLQQWFATATLTSKRDPYFLYAASNLGSLIALLAYPFVMEMYFGLGRQLELWTGFYLVFYVLILVCAGITMGRTVSTVPEPLTQGSQPAFSRLLRWVLLAFVPSSMMLGLTSFITADLAAAPLTWVAPLAIYLLSFILTFARIPILPHRLFVILTPALLLILALILVSGAVDPLAFFIPVHILVFFAVAMLCHGELARDRPAPSQLTLFYLMLSIGGVLGGFFNAIISPLVFDSVLEYPLILLLAALLCPPREKGDESPVERQQSRINKILYECILACLPAVLLYLMIFILPDISNPIPAETHTVSLQTSIAFALSLLLCYLAINRPVRYALALGLWMIVGFKVYEIGDGETLFAERSYFGVHTVKYVPEKGQTFLYHGSTTHGLQNTRKGSRQVPGMYYHPSGPAGQLLTRGQQQFENVAIVGLGTGALSAYAGRGQTFSFFEIDPVIRQIGETDSLFSFITDARKRHAVIHIIIGDARLQLDRTTDKHFELLVLDAFSSGAIPVHLLTREAIEIYRNKITHDGMLLFHISNHYLELYPIIARIGKELGMNSYIQNNIIESKQELRDGKSASQWVLLTMPDSDITLLEFGTGRWNRLTMHDNTPLWTDEFSNIVEILKL